MKKLDVLEHRNLLIQKIKDYNTIYTNDVIFEEKQYSNSLFDKTVLLYKTYSFDSEYKLYKNKKLILSSEVFKISYVFEYNKEKDKLSLYLIEAGIKKSKESCYYSTRKTHVLCIRNDGKLYVIPKHINKPVLCNFKKDHYKYSRYFTTFGYITPSKILRISNSYNSITSYIYTSLSHDGIIKFKDVANANTVEELLNNTVKKELSEKFCNNCKPSELLTLYYKLSKKSIKYINDNVHKLDVLSTNQDTCYFFKKIYLIVSNNVIFLEEKYNEFYFENNFFYGFKNRYRNGNKIDITDLNNSMNKSIDSSCVNYFKNKMKEFLKKPFNFRINKNIKLNVMYSFDDNYKFKFVKNSNDKELVDYLYKEPLKSCKTIEFLNKKCSFIKIYNNQKELIDIIFSSSNYHFWSYNNIKYKISNNDISVSGCIYNSNVNVPF